MPFATPHIINLLTDPKEREPYNPIYLHTWTFADFGRLMKEFQESVKREPLIPAGAPLDHVPAAIGASGASENRSIDTHPQED